ncbi:MAG: peptidoglycan editing factor PgeF [Lachnospiraceae bacterium]|nr:peptidoglycan editing factor PgeF [Lachnospiraceae bacterium]
MNSNYKNEVLYYTFPNWENSDYMIHGFSSRECGVSTGYYSSLNLGLKTGDDMDNIKANYEIFFKTLGLDINSIVIPELAHGNDIGNVTHKDAGSGLLTPYVYLETDGLLTNEKGVSLVATFADCVPVFFTDPVKKVVGIAHCGWRGCANGLAGKMVDRMISDYGCDVKDIEVGIGPSIGMCCFEVDIDVFMEFVELPFLTEGWYFENDDETKYNIDLWRVLHDNLIYKGVSEDKITISGLCTCCNNDIFFSHRFTKGKRGTMAGVIALI